MLRWTAFDPATELVLRDGRVGTSRPLESTGALLILEAAIIAIAMRWPSQRGAVYIAMGAAIAVLILEHRTLWVTGVVVGAVAFRWWFRGRTGSEREAFGVAGLLVLLVPIAIWGFTQSKTFTESAVETTSSNSTLSWRTTSWEELISGHTKIADIVFGQPAGASLARVVNGGIVTRSPHDEFVDTYLRFGLPGLLLLCGFGVLLWRRRDTIASSSALTSHAVGLLLLTQFLYSITYGLDAVQGVVDGLLISALIAGTATSTSEAATLRVSAARSNASVKRTTQPVHALPT